jgi:hypothetical protein
MFFLVCVCFYYHAGTSSGPRWNTLGQSTCDQYNNYVSIIQTLIAISEAKSTKADEDVTHPDLISAMAELNLGKADASATGILKYIFKKEYA